MNDLKKLKSVQKSVQTVHIKLRASLFLQSDDPLKFFDYRAPFHMVFCDGVLLAIYSIFLLLTQLKRTKIIREIFRAKAIVLIIAMVASIGKRISIQESEGFFQFWPELVYAKVDAALLKWHFAFEPQIYLMYGMVNSLFLCEQMLNSYFLFEIYSCTCKMEARGESKRSLTCPILRCSCLSSLFHSWAFPWN